MRLVLTFAMLNQYNFTLGCNKYPPFKLDAIAYNSLLKICLSLGLLLSVWQPWGAALPTSVLRAAAKEGLPESDQTDGHHSNADEEINRFCDIPPSIFQYSDSSCYCTRHDLGKTLLCCLVKSGDLESGLSHCNRNPDQGGLPAKVTSLIIEGPTSQGGGTQWDDETEPGGAHQVFPKIVTLDFWRLRANMQDILDPTFLEELRIVGTKLNLLVLCSSSHNLSSKSVPSCARLKSLRVLDVRDNRLNYVQAEGLPALGHVYLSGNRWACFKEWINVDWSRPAGLKSGQDHRGQLLDASSSSSNPLAAAIESPDLGWLLNDHQKRLLEIHFPDKTFCALPNVESVWHLRKNKTRGKKLKETASFFGHSGITLLNFLAYQQDMKRSCPSGCSCQVMTEGSPISQLKNTVICTNANLTELPQILPKDTEYLDVSHNKIKRLSLIRTSPHYASLKSLAAANNLIESMNDLIGSRFVHNGPEFMDLQYNKIKHYNIDLLESILSNFEERNGSTMLLFAGNPWICDCDTVPQVKEFLAAHKDLLVDANALECENKSDYKIMAIDVNVLCHEKADVDYLAWVVVVEVILLVMVLSKLSYDFWNYRKTGELPWLARRTCMGVSSSTSAAESLGRTKGFHGNNTYQPHHHFNKQIEDQQGVVNSRSSMILGCLRCGASPEGSLRSGAPGMDSKSTANSSSQPYLKFRSFQEIVFMFRPGRATDSSIRGSSGQPSQAGASLTTAGKYQSVSAGDDTLPHHEPQGTSTLSPDLRPMNAAGGCNAPDVQEAPHDLGLDLEFEEDHERAIKLASRSGGWQGSLNCVGGAGPQQRSLERRSSLS